MKKSNRILILLITFVSFSAIGKSQIVMNTPHYSDFSERDLSFSKSPAGMSTAVSQKAVKNFSKAYVSATGAEWSTLADRSMLCRFSMHNMVYRAFYTNKGKWMYTVTGYEAALLKKDIYDMVKRVYYNSTIVYVNQIELVDAKPIYVVEVRDEKSIKKIRVQGDDLQEISELTRL